MICYVVTRKHSHMMHDFLELWAPELAPLVKIVSYESLLTKTTLPRAAYIFSDIERLRPGQLPQLEAIYQTLENEKAGQTLLNHPSRSMKRYELLRTLNAHGYNPFNIYRLDEIPSTLSFPVFVRGENDHHGSLTGLINTHDELSAALSQLQPSSDRDKVVIEFCETSDGNGVFRKYSAYIVADQIIPQHMMFGNHWHMKGVLDLALKKSDLYEERDYLRDNPHEQYLRKICNLANISYGRIDYGVIDGQPVVWEINTNPTLMNTRSLLAKCCVTRAPFVQKMINAFSEINCPADHRDGIAAPVVKAGASQLAYSAYAYWRDNSFYLRKILWPRLKKRRKVVVRDFKKKLRRVRKA